MNTWIFFYSELCYYLAIWACRVFIQSTLLISFGLLIVKVLGIKSPAFRSSTYRFVFCAAVLCPLLSVVGIPNLHSLSLPLEKPFYSYSTSQRTFLQNLTLQSTALSDKAISPAEQGIALETPIANPGWPKTRSQTDFRYDTGAYSVGWLILYSVLSTIWISGSITLLIRLGFALVLTRKMRNYAAPASKEVSDLAHQIAGEIGISTPTVLISKYAKSPFLTGIVRPTIVLPKSMPQTRNAHVLTHELAHHMRRDCIWNLIYRMTIAIYFYQPLLWKLVQHLEETSEEICDSCVVCYTGKRTHYARCLVALAEELGFCSRFRLVGIAVTGFKSSLGHRVERILTIGRNTPIHIAKRTRYSIYLVGIAVVLLLNFLGICSNGSGKRTQWLSFVASSPQREGPLEDHIQVLTKALSSQNKLERARAVQAVGNMGIKAKPAIPQLIDRLYDKDWLVRKAAGQALAQMGSEAHIAVIPLIELLESDPEWLVRESCNYALAAIGSMPHTSVSPLVNALDDPEWQVRKAAAVALTAFGSTSAPAVPRLTKALHDPEWQVRWSASHALAAIGPLASPAVSDLTHVLQDDEWQVRQSAALALGSIGQRAETAKPALMKCLDDPQWPCRHAANVALHKIAQGNSATVPMSIDALPDLEWNRQKAASQTLQKTI